MATTRHKSARKQGSLCLSVPFCGHSFVSHPTDSFVIHRATVTTKLHPGTLRIPQGGMHYLRHPVHRRKRGSNSLSVVSDFLRISPFDIRIFPHELPRPTL